MHRHHFQRSLAIVVLVAASPITLSACAHGVTRPSSAPGPSSTPPSHLPPPSPSASAEPEPPPPPLPNIAELSAQLERRIGPVTISATAEGQVLRIEFKAKRGAHGTAMAAFDRDLMEVGDLLGYGRLGPATFEGSSGISGGPVGSFVGHYSAASACPGLRFEAAFQRIDQEPLPVEVARVWAFACPASPGAIEGLQRAHASIEELAKQTPAARPAASLPPDDPIVAAVRSSGLVIADVSRDDKEQRFTLQTTTAFTGDRYASTQVLAERIARAASFPPLDVVDLDASANAREGTASQASLRSTFTTFTLRANAPR